MLLSSTNLIGVVMKKIVLSLFILSNLSLAIDDEELLSLAKKNHLAPIPKSKLELLELIDNPNSPLSDEKIELGKVLFFDPRLSSSGLISCHTCHNLGLGGADGISVATGHKWQENPLHLNSPTVYNSVFSFSQFYDGRSPDLADQAVGPIHADFEMASSAKEIEDKLSSIKGYQKLFDDAYGVGTKMTFDKVTDAIAAFESILITPSRYDDYLLGDIKALSDEEKEGFRLFMDKRCVSCHRGVALGGVLRFFRYDRFSYNDIGGFSGNDNNLVKVPTLRNITQTAPYFHNGTVWDLKETIFEMAKVQLNIKISDDEANKILEFLKSLDGDKPKVTYPMLPF